MNEFNLGEAAPCKNDEGDIMTSLSLPYFAVPVLESISIPLLILFGNLIAPASLILSYPCAFKSSNSY